MSRYRRWKRDLQFPTFFTCIFTVFSCSSTCVMLLYMFHHSRCLNLAPLLGVIVISTKLKFFVFCFIAALSLLLKMAHPSSLSPWRLCGAHYTEIAISFSGLKWEFQIGAEFTISCGSFLCWICAACVFTHQSSSLWLLATFDGNNGF